MNRFKPLNLVIGVLLILVFVTAKKTLSNDMTDDNSLLGTSWWVEDIGGAGVIDSSHTTIQFPDAGQIAGDTGCNRYFGSVEIGEISFKTGPLAGTRKACAASLMDQEMKFYQALDKVVSWDWASTDLLYLRDADGVELIRASKTNE